MRFVLILFWLGAAAAAAAATPQTANGLAVIVNNEVITFKDVQNMIESEFELLQSRYGNNPEVLSEKINEMRRDRIEELVERELILHEYATAGYNVPESFIENKINQDIREHGDRLTLTKTLQAQGLTYEAYRSRVRDRIILELMWEHHVPRDPVVSPNRIEEYYRDNLDKFRKEDQVKLRIIVCPNFGDAKESRRLADDVLRKLNEGVSFEEMARVYSQGSQRLTGGDMDWRERSELRKELADQAFVLKPGERSGVIETPEGCFIMLVEEARLAHVRPLAEVREEIEVTLKDQEKKLLRQRWIKRLKEKSFVRYF